MIDVLITKYIILCNEKIMRLYIAMKIYTVCYTEENRTHTLPKTHTMAFSSAGALAVITV